MPLSFPFLVFAPLPNALSLSLSLSLSVSLSLSLCLSLSLSLSVLRTSIEDEEEEQETELAEGEERESDQPHVSLQRNGKTLAKLTEVCCCRFLEWSSKKVDSETVLIGLCVSCEQSLKTRSPSKLLRENLLPGEEVIVKIEQMAHIVCERAELVRLPTAYLFEI